MDAGICHPLVDAFVDKFARILVPDAVAVVVAELPSDEFRKHNTNCADRPMIPPQQSHRIDICYRGLSNCYHFHQHSMKRNNTNHMKTS